MHNSEIEWQLEQIAHRLHKIERTLETMATRADFDAALLALGVAIDQAIIRVGAGGAFTDADIATLNADTAKVNQIGSGGGGGGGVTFNPPFLIGGGAVTGTISLGSPAAAGGETFSCSVDTPDATVPGSVTVGAGASSVDFSISTLAVGVKETVNCVCASPLHTFKNSFVLTP